MNVFDNKAADWDKNPMHAERSSVIADSIKKNLPLTRKMTAMEFGAGTGTTSFLLAGLLQEITMIDNSPEMVKRMNEKISQSGIKNLKAVNADLEHKSYKGSFDLIFTQMVLHHIPDIDGIITKFHGLLKPGGLIAIADLYAEDGDFHGAEFQGHNGFDPDELSGKMQGSGFVDILHEKCYSFWKEIPEKGRRLYDIFLLTASKPE